MRIPATLTALLIALASLGQVPDTLADPTPDWHQLQAEAGRFRTGSLITMGFGLAVGLPLLMQDESNLQAAGAAFTTFAFSTSFVLFAVSARKEERARKMRPAGR